MQLTHGDQDRPARQHRRLRVEVHDLLEALVGEERQELVGETVRPRTGHRRGRLHDQRRVQLALDQDETAGDSEHGLLGVGGGQRVRGVRGRDGGDGALELLLGDPDDLRRNAAGVGEREDRGLVADEQHRAGALLLGVPLRAAGGAVVAARGVVAGEQPVRFFVADLGAYVLADVEHARHGGSLDSVRGDAGPFPVVHAEFNGSGSAGVTRGSEATCHRLVRKGG